MSKPVSPIAFKHALAGLAILILLAAPRAFAAETAAQVIDRFHETLITVMKKGPELGFQGRVRLISPVADRSFDYAQMTERSVGPSWAGMSASDKNKLVAAFRKFSIYTYAHEFRSYDGERFEHTGEPKESSSGNMLVRTQIVPSDGEEPTSLNYLLHQKSPSWQIYDVYLAGTISEVARRRADFAAVLREKGAAGMAAALDQKSAQIEADDAKVKAKN
jgi:phospholipid transport system substrate-binding protein